MFVTGSRFVVVFVEMFFLLSSLSTFAAEEDGNTTDNPAGKWCANQSTSEPIVTEGFNFDDDDFDDLDSTSDDGFTSPIINEVYGGAVVLGMVFSVCGCYACFQRNRRWQQARHLATMALPPQFPNGIHRMQLVNQE